MNGRRLKDFMIQAIGGIADSDLFYMWGCLDEAVCTYIHDTKDLIGTVDITTVEDQQVYNLPPDFLQLHVKNTARRLAAKYNDGTNTCFPLASTYENLWTSNKTTAKARPDAFAIYQRVTMDDYVTGSATADGDAANGVCVLTDDTADFVTAGIYPRDEIHNPTDDSDGVVISVTDATRLTAAMFGGAVNSWTLEDEYTIVRQPVNVVMLDAPSETAGHTLTIPYIKKPAPVYNDYGQWQIPAQACPGIAALAAYLFRARYDYEPQNDQHLRAQYDQAVLIRKQQIAAGILQARRYPRRQ